MTRGGVRRFAAGLAAATVTLGLFGAALAVAGLVRAHLPLLDGRERILLVLRWAAVAGTMYLMYYGVVSFYDGFVPGIKAFTAAVLGGIGSLPGAVIGGLLIGLIETMWSAYFSIDYKDVAAFSILAITLIFLPQGLLGRPEVEKV